MGREIKRVPLDFNHPNGEIWPGFMNPYWKHSTECRACAGSGSSPLSRVLHAAWYMHDSPQQLLARIPESEAKKAVAAFVSRFAYARYGAWHYNLEQSDVDALLEKGRLRDFRNKPSPTAQQVNVWAREGFGHDAINSWICISRRLETWGVEGTCPECGGDGRKWELPAYKYLYEEWKPIEPPKGEGYQIWETVTEGSPISPVFADVDKTVEWLVGQGYSEKAARNFVQSEWVPSLAMIDGEILSNVEIAGTFHDAAADQQAKE